MGVSVVINNHSTASKPYPHVVYIVEVSLDSTKLVLQRRYSEFVALHEALKDGFTLPPKHAFLTTIFPSGWLDDMIISERKVGLAKYLAAVLWSPEYRDTPLIQGFLDVGAIPPPENLNVEDILPSTLRRKDISAFFSARAQEEKRLISSAYYPEWCAASMPPESLDFTKFDIIFFGFAVPNGSSSLDWGPDTKALLKRLVACAKASGAGTKIVLSIGGWNGSQWFSHLCSNAANRITFIQTVLQVVDSFELDGIDLDWEFPNSKGVGNPYSANDASNFLLLIQALRSALGLAKIISAAVGHAPWHGADGLTLSDVSAFAGSLSYINIMNYSVWGTSTPGPNSPLGQVVKNQRRVQSTAEAALHRWKAAGFPTSQMLLGLPLFGHVFKSKKTSLNGGIPATPADNILSFASHTFKGAHKFVHIKDLGKKANSKGALSAWWGKPIAFKDIVASGALVKKFDGNYGHGDGFTMAWDDPSSTPYLFNVENKTLITFDNTRSLAAKAKFAKDNDMAGCCTWSLDQDDGTSLQDVIRTAMGK